MADEDPTVSLSVAKTPPITNVTDRVSVQIQPGEQTTEHAMAIAHNFQALLLKILGMIVLFGSTMAEMSPYFPQNARTLHILQVAGVVTTAAAQLSQALVTGNYIEGRSIVKSAAGKLLDGKQ